MDTSGPVLAIVIPCYNETQVISKTCHRIQELISKMIAESKIDQESFVCFVDDGSTDGTWGKIDDLCVPGTNTYGIKLSRNFGHQNALLAGLIHVKERADCAITLDADLQQDEQAIPSFIEKFKQGADIVYGIRNDRETDGLFKRVTALFFYRLMSLLGVEMKRNHADYRLMSKSAIQALAEYEEGNLFLRGIVPQLGFSQDTVNFNVSGRDSGESKYTFSRMIAFALNGITSFSVTPLRFVTATGFIFTLFSVAMLVYILFMRIVYQTAIPGWASQVLPVYLLGGIQLLSLGILGEYIGRIYMESKRRPRYIIEASNLD